jgi:serine/threonine-protein kinase
VKHPGAVVVLDDDVAEDGSAFLVMELLDGRSVEDLWLHNGGRLPPKMVMSIGRELCEVLEVAHRAGIVHRDIKPANLFLTRDGRLKVLDFGIARLRDSAGTSATQTGMVFGTPAFMSPEQAAGLTNEVDGQTDVWAVGATMFTLLSGAVVHEGQSQQHLVVLAATKPARSLASVLPRADEPIVAVVDRALLLDKEARWPTAEAMRSAICDASRTLFGNAAPQLAGMSETLQLRIRAGASGTDRETLESAADVRARAVGATTEPVSSTAPTKRMPRASALALAIASTVAAVFRRSRSERLQESRSNSTSPRMRVTRSPRTLAVGAGVVGVGLVAGAVTLRGQSPSERRDQASALSGGSAAVGGSAPAPIELPAERDAQAPPTTASTISSVRQESVASVREPSSSPPRVVNRNGAHVPATASTRRPNCTPPYIVTAEGKQLWKEECL